MAKHTPLVCQYLEKISRTALENYQGIIREYVAKLMGSMRYIAGTGSIMSAWQVIYEFDSDIIYVTGMASRGIDLVCISQLGIVTSRNWNPLF